MAPPFAYAPFAFLFEFLPTAVGLAGAAVGVPIIIHLLNRRRFKIVEWAAMRFLIQAQNDYSLWPSELLGPEIRRREDPNRAKVYPAFGTTREEGHADFSTHPGGIAAWGNDVLAFLHAAGVD